jgi:hypothetical protein
MFSWVITGHIDAAGNRPWHGKSCTQVPRQAALPERRSQSRMSCDRSTSSTVQKLATAFLYSSHRSWYLQQGGPP